MKADFSSPIKKIGQYSFHGIIDDYYNAELEIGNYTSIASPLYIHGKTEHPCIFNKSFVSTYPFGDKWNVDYPMAQSKGKIIIGNDVWIGESVTIMSGITIGDGAIIGARSVVAKDIPAFEIWIGNPARFIRERFTVNQIDKLEKIKWWNWSREKVIENLEYFKDINKFVEKFG